MAHKRTKKQKMKAAQRRGIEISARGYSIADHVVTPSKPTLLSIATAKTEKDHSYVFNETKQTVLVTTAIIVGQIILAALIRTNLIHLPF